MSGVLLAFFLLLFSLPFCSLDSESALPACCRRDGKHHCAMTARAVEFEFRDGAKPVARATTPDCPYRSQLLMPLAWRALFVHGEPVFSAPGDSVVSLGVETMFIARLSESRSHRKRGPPSLLV